MIISLFCSINAGCGTRGEETAKVLRSAETDKEGHDIKPKDTANKESEKSTDKDDKNTPTSNNTNDPNNTSTMANTTNITANTTPAQQTQPSLYVEQSSQPTQLVEQPTTPVHTHSFDIPIYSTVHHEATGHYQTVVVGHQWVVDQTAWDEAEQAAAYVCNKCGWYSISDGATEISLHIGDAHDWKSSYHTDYVNVGTIHHDEVGHYVDITEDQWVQDSEAYDEQVVVGYQCSCGAVE